MGVLVFALVNLAVTYTSSVSMETVDGVGYEREL